MLQSITMLKANENVRKQKVHLKHSFSLICTSISGKVLKNIRKMFMVLHCRHKATYTYTHWN